MSMQVDLRHPELGYFDEGMKLTDAAVYASATLPFGLASMLPPVAYRSKAFHELENEKVWTRSWAVIGLTSQIPNPGDMLPFTLGMHGIHVQRQADGSIAARMNRHQHGGCRFVPEQCRSGRQTKCSITSCNYTRDSDVMEGGANGENTDLMYKFAGLTPERLAPVACAVRGPFIFVNLDPECEPIEEYLTTLPGALFADPTPWQTLAGKQWLDSAANWKMVGSALTVKGASASMPGGHEAEAPRPPTGVETGFAALASFHSLSWVFPNMLLAIGRENMAVVLLQATGTEKTLCRAFLLTSTAEALMKAPETFAEWLSFLREASAAAEGMHRDQVELGTARRPGTGADSPPLESNPSAYALNRFLVHRLQIEHHYYWNAPIMDAAMLMRGSR